MVGLILEIPLGIMYYLDCCVGTVSFLGYELTRAIHNIVGGTHDNGIYANI